MENIKIRAIITGATGMVGEGVLHECLQHSLISSSNYVLLNDNLNLFLS